VSRREIMSWDWKAQPDLDRLAAVVLEMSGGRVHMRQAETGSDEYALVVSDEPLSQAEATREYMRSWE
jgi:hypothetical protein